MAKKVAEETPKKTKKLDTLTLQYGGEAFTADVSELTINAITSAIGAISLKMPPVKAKGTFILVADGKRATTTLTGGQLRLMLNNPVRAQIFAKRLTSLLR